jgi:antitoxin FitA
VPPDVRNELAARAARAGQSMQEFLLAELVRLASKPSVDELHAQVREVTASTRLDRSEILADRDSERR